jgi:hypothetical protein
MRDLLRGLLSAAVAACVLPGCQSTHVEGEDEELDPAVVADSFCRWQAECFPEDYAREYSGFQHCIATEQYRHSVPENCGRANVDLKACLVEVSCEEAQEIKPALEQQVDNPDASLPDDPLPCGTEIIFYALACAEFECDDGETVDRQDVCNIAVDCFDGSDEEGCPPRT